MKKTLKHKVAVYGTLLQGFRNHEILARHMTRGTARYLGESVTKQLFLMFDLGSFPGLSNEPKNKVHVEIYELDDSALDAVRWLEGYEEGNKGMYSEQVIETEYGEAIIYIYNRSFHMSSIINPDSNNIISWKKHKGYGKKD